MRTVQCSSFAARRIALRQVVNFESWYVNPWRRNPFSHKASFILWSCGSKLRVSSMPGVYIIGNGVKGVTYDKESNLQVYLIESINKLLRAYFYRVKGGGCYGR